MPVARAVLLFAAALPLLACQRSESPAPKPEPSVSTAPQPKLFGEPLGPGETVKLSTLLSEPAKYRDKSVIVEAEVRKACSRKGCWMEVSESKDAAAPACRVTFKDYGFFVPLDSAGSRARMQATVTVETVAANYVQHLEEEGARFPKKNPDGTADEVRLVATGVELTRPEG
jgi:hypothetical protein